MTVSFRRTVRLLQVVVVAALARSSMMVQGQSTSTSSYDHYAGYLPTHSITDLAALDLDQYEINVQLTARKLLPAKQLYEQGGHSGSYANITLVNIDAAGSYPQGTTVWGQNDNGVSIMGYLEHDVSWTATDESPNLKIVYPVGPRQDTYSDCQVGGLWHLQKANRDGCFTGSGTLGLGDDRTTATAWEYSYDTRLQNGNARTLQSLSTLAGETMKSPRTNAWIAEFQIFVDYYGSTDYADKIIQSDYDKQHTNFPSTRGNLDFTLFQQRMGQAEAFKKGIVYLHIWMQVVLYLHRAVDQCYNANAIVPPTTLLTAVQYLDNAVALYTGSLTTDPDETGILLHGLADVRSHQFKTAGHQMNSDTGMSFVNIKIMDTFRTFKQILTEDAINDADPDLCAKAELSKTAIINLMKVPLVQGLLRYTYMRQYEMDNVSLDDSEKIIAESATFAATMLPFIHQCNPRAAATIYDNCKIGAKTTNYAAVQHALLSVYSCLGINDCQTVGGIWDEVNQQYLPHGMPCGMEDSSVRKKSPVGGFFRFVGISAGILVAAYLLMKYKNRILAYVRHTRKQHQQQKHVLPTSQFTGNIAAVAEIS